MNLINSSASPTNILIHSWRNTKSIRNIGWMNISAFLMNKINCTVWRHYIMYGIRVDRHPVTYVASFSLLFGITFEYRTVVETKFWVHVNCGKFCCNNKPTKFPRKIIVLSLSITPPHKAFFSSSFCSACWCPLLDVSLPFFFLPFWTIHGQLLPVCSRYPLD